MKFILREIGKLRALKGLIWEVLSKRDRLWLMLTILGQALLSLFDALGILLVGVLFTVTTTNQLQDSVIGKTELYQSLSTFQIQFGLYLMIILCLGLRSVGSLALNKFTLLKLSFMQCSLSTSLLHQIQSKDSSFLQRHNIQEISQLLTGATNALFLGVIANTMIVLAETTLLLMYITIFALINPVLAAFTAFTFLFTGFLSQRILGTKSKNLLAKQIEETVKARDTINDAILMLDENRVSGEKTFLSDKFNRSFSKASDSYAKAVFTNLIPKFIFEIILVLMGLIVLFYSTLDSSQSQKNFLIIFLSASSRLLPSIMKIQAGLMSIYASLGMSFGLRNFDDDLKFDGTPDPADTESTAISKDSSLICIQPFSMSYKDSDFEVHASGIVIERNQLTLIYGASGSGKSSIVRCILGLSSNNEVTLNNMMTGGNSINDLRNYFESAYYLNQKAHLLKDSIRMNITLQPDGADVDSSRLIDSIRDAGLEDFLNSLPQGLYTKIAEIGSNLSGGQLQRVSLARAFYSNSELLVFDEPTNAMDKNTEDFIIQSLINKSKTSTVIVVSHQSKFLQASKRSYEVRDGFVLEHASRE